MGKLTIGVGRNLDDEGITKEEALYLLNNDIQRIKGELASLPNFSQLSEPRQRVLTEMGFNIGLEGLMKFKEMWQAIQAQDWDGAANAMLDSLWAKEVGTTRRPPGNMYADRRGGCWPTVSRRIVWESISIKNL